VTNIPAQSNLPRVAYHPERSRPHDDVWISLILSGKKSDD
jgi:hypothetical protein